MDLQPTRQFDYLQRTLSIFLSNSSDMSEQFELLIDELIKENKHINKSPKVNNRFLFIRKNLTISFSRILRNLHHQIQNLIYNQYPILRNHYL